MGSSKTTNTTVTGPAAQLPTERAVMESNLAARDALRRNMVRRGIWNTIRNAGGMRGDLSAPVVRTASLLGGASAAPAPPKPGM